MRGKNFDGKTNVDERWMNLSTLVFILLPHTAQQSRSSAVAHSAALIESQDGETGDSFVHKVSPTLQNTRVNT
jgi:hypothetical protein